MKSFSIQKRIPYLSSMLRRRGSKPDGRESPGTSSGTWFTKRRKRLLMIRKLEIPPDFHVCILDFLENVQSPSAYRIIRRFRNVDCISLCLPELHIDLAGSRTHYYLIT